MFAEPYNRTRLYIFNPSGSDVEVAVLSFQAEFEPLTLALSEIEVEMPKEFETSMAITSFNAPLPSGNNKIGKVEVTNGVTAADVTVLKENTQVTAENTQVTAENTQVTAENTASTKTLSQSIVHLLGGLLSSTRVEGKTNLVNIMGSFEYLLDLLPKLFSPIYYQRHAISFDKKNQNEEILIFGVKPGVRSGLNPYPVTIKMLTNDGESDLMLKMQAFGDTDQTTLPLKPGESIRDLRIHANYITVSGTNYSFRALLTKGWFDEG